MLASSIRIIGGNESAAVLVDPLRDFVERGRIFDKAYGIEDMYPLLRVVDNMRKMAVALKGKLQLVLNASQYKEDLFVSDSPALRGLCSTEEGRESVIDPNLFDTTIVKTHNSLLTAGEEAEKIIDTSSNIILCGITGTSCVPKTVDDILRSVRNHIPLIILPADVIGSRAGRQRDQEEILQRYAESMQNVVVTSSWKNILVS